MAQIQVLALSNGRIPPHWQQKAFRGSVKPVRVQNSISLSDDAMDLIVRLTAPLMPVDRTALVCALAMLLRSEPQPPGDGVVVRHLGALLRTGLYRRQTN
jgi:hypothetical protein